MIPKLDKARRRLARWNGSPIRYELGGYRDRLEAIGALDPSLRELTDRELEELSRRLHGQALEGASAPELLPEAFALVREVSRRALGLRPFDVQILAAIALHEGNLVEMATGEGKTLAAILPAYLHGLTGLGVHILTFNDYLARRDAEWMGPVFRFLGLSVGWIEEGMDETERRTAYRRDITYVTAKEAGFDLLRSQLDIDALEPIQRPFHFAIVDEADSILIDEARAPLVIAGETAGEAAGQAVGKPKGQMGAAAIGEPSAPDAAALVAALEFGTHYSTDEYSQSIDFTEQGLDTLENRLGCGNLLAAENLDRLTRLHAALHAAVLLRRDVDYIVRAGRIELVDEFTGRTVEDRHWPDGLQAALEAKENLGRRPEGAILGSITLQHFVRLYPKLAGMTATAQPTAGEFHHCYGLKVVVIPPNRVSIRVDHPDLVFTHREAKHRALAKEITRAHSSRRPVLVGTSSVEESETLASRLRESGIEARVLNARNDAQEADVVAAAGALGAVTISTNMAGRGTDIRLGGTDESDRDRVVELGGLLVLGTNRHESVRIDQQLRGRAGRQGDPGSSRFFVSLEDDLIARYGVRQLIPASLLPDLQEQPLDNPVIRREIARAQKIVEGQNGEIRKKLFGYTSLVEQQRRGLHEKRAEVLAGRAPSRLAELAPELHCKLSQLADLESIDLGDLEKRVTLHHFNREWSAHLARLADIREGIHLVRVGGDDPLEKFCRLAADSIRQLQARIDAEVVSAFEMALRNGRLELPADELRGPSSTWTYLVQDDPFRDQLAMHLGGNVGLAAAAALYTGPLLIAWGIYNRFFRRRGRR